MPTYYAEIPGYEEAKAEIEAPSTKKARTTFLRYLHSRGYIEHGTKSEFRDDILVRRMIPGQFPVTVRLRYGGGPEVEELGEARTLGPMPSPEIEEEEVEEVRYPEPERIPITPVIEGEEIEIEEEEEWPRMGKMREMTRPRPIDSGSPIMDLSRRTRGM
jgi:hypothetical protein